MNLTTLLGHIGLGDGEGNTSLMRVVVLLMILAVLVPAVYIAVYTRSPLTLTNQDLELIGLALGAKCVQNAQEAQQKPTDKPPTER